MKTKLFLLTSFLALSLLGFTTALAGVDGPGLMAQNQTGTLVETVRQATERYKNISQAEAAGYGLFHGCVSGPQEGSMGIHFVNGDLVGDGALDPARPEALLYAFKNGKMELTAVEYVVIADDWNANNAAPPVLMGQLFNYVGSPNRYSIPAFYELHVWAWEQNPLGTFADWNPRVSCDEYTAGDALHAAEHQAPASVDRSPADACANLPPNASLICTNARPAPARENRSPADACANLPPNGPVSCTNTRKASAP